MADGYSRDQLSQEFDAELASLPSQENDLLGTINATSPENQSLTPESPSPETTPDQDPAALLEQKYGLSLENLSDIERHQLESALTINLDAAEFALMGDKIIAYDAAGHRAAIDIAHASKIFGRSEKYRTEMKMLADLSREFSQPTISHPEAPTNPENHLESVDNVFASPLPDLPSYDAATIDSALTDRLENGPYDFTLDIQSLGSQLEAATPEQQAQILASLPESVRDYVQTGQFRELAHAKGLPDIISALRAQSPELQAMFPGEGRPLLDSIPFARTATEFFRQIGQHSPELQNLFSSREFQAAQSLLNARSLEDFVTAAAGANPENQAWLHSPEFQQFKDLLQNPSPEALMNSPIVPDFIKAFVSEIATGMQRVDADFAQINEATGHQFADLLDLRRIISEIFRHQMFGWQLGQLSSFLRLRAGDGTSYFATNPPPAR